MAKKLVSQLNGSGYFIGPTYADESPEEPGVFHLPGGCVDVDPPEIPDGQRARWVAGEWIFEANTDPEDEEAAETIEQWRAKKTVSRMQAKAALYLAGRLDEVEAMMEAPETPMLAKLAWRDALDFRRMSPTVLTMGSALGLSAEDLDDLFIAAGQIEA